MVGPTYTLRANRFDDADGSHQRSPAWCVALIRYLEPAAAYSGTTPNATQPIMIIENDCIEISCDNMKTDVIKSCILKMKVGEVYYLNAVAPGDWVVVWINNYQEEIDKIIDALNDLNNNQTASKILCDWNSGLKFIGRVSKLSSSDVVYEDGRRIITQIITCRAFLEFATTVYWMDTARAFFLQTFGEGDSSTITSRANAIMQIAATEFFGGQAAKVLVDFFTPSKDQTAIMYPSPDRAVLLYFILMLGVQNDTIRKSFMDSTQEFQINGILNRAISVPPVIGQILQKPYATKLWQLLNIYSGLQIYSIRGPSSKPWENFAPITDVLPSAQQPVFFVSAQRLKGWVPFYPVTWDIKTLWEIMSDYLHSILNEMYTVFRIDQFNCIRPSLVIREKPFGTALYNYLTPYQQKIIERIQPDASIESTIQNIEQQRKEVLADFKTQFGEISMDNQSVVRAMYDTHPRWIIDESLILNLQTQVSDSRRVNFVQVWGTNALFLSQPKNVTANQQNSVEEWKHVQIGLGNIYADYADIARNGLRADIVTSPFDFPATIAGTHTAIWARIRADWLFNGHLKAFGSVTLAGIVEPICEGDNIEIRGIVYHIDSVSHHCTIVDGRKKFITEISFSNGITAYSLDNNKIPTYLMHMTSNANNMKYITGATDVQATKHQNRNNVGDLIIKNKR